MAGKPRVKDEDVRAAEELMNIGREQAEGELAQVRAHLEVVGDEREAVGILKKIRADRAYNDLIEAVVLYKVKKSKDYRKAGLTWIQFCDANGFPQTTADLIIRDVRPIFEGFSANLADLVGLKLNEIRVLGSAVSANLAEIQGNRLLFDGEAIPFEPEAVQAVIEKLQDDLKTEKEDKKASLSAKDKVLKAKEDLLNKQERQLQKFDKEAKAKGLSLDEDAFVQRMGNLRTGFIGFMLQVEPMRMEDLSADNDPSVLMRAEYIATIHAMKMQILAAYDTAVEMYGDPTMLPEESGWTPGQTS